MSISHYTTNYVIKTLPAERRGILTNQNFRAYCEALQLLVHAIVYEYCDSPCKHGTPAAWDTRGAVVNHLVDKLKSNSIVCRTLLLTTIRSKRIDDLVTFLRNMFNKCLILIRKYNRCAADRLVLPNPCICARMPYAERPQVEDEADPYIQRVLGEMVAAKQYLVPVKNTN